MQSGKTLVKQAFNGKKSCERGTGEDTDVAK